MTKIYIFFITYIMLIESSFSQQFSNSKEASRNDDLIDLDMELFDILADENCENKIKEVFLTGNTVLNGRALKKLYNKYLGKCITKKILSDVLTETILLYLEKGYITSRAIIVVDSLPSGIIKLKAIEGKINSLTKKDINDTTYSIPLSLRNLEGEILNVRLFEQAIEEFNRLPKTNVKVDYIPSTNKEGYTNVVFYNNENNNKFSGSLSMNHLGAEETGKYKLNGSVTYANLFSINDVLKTSLSLSFKDSFEYGSSENYNVQLDLPYRYFNLLYSKGLTDYDSIIDLPNQKAKSEGKSLVENIELAYTLYRDASTKVVTSAKVEDSTSENFLEGSKIAVSSYGTRRFSSNFMVNKNAKSYNLNINLGISKGLKRNSKDPIPGNFNYNTLIYNLDINLSKPIKIKNGIINYSNSIKFQHTYKKQINETFSLGGDSNVRGTKSSILFGDSGYYSRNDFVFDMSPKNKEEENLREYIITRPYILADFGSTYDISTKKRGFIYSSGVGVKLTTAKNNFNFDLYSALSKFKNLLSEDEYDDNSLTEKPPSHEFVVVATLSANF